jgi:hypothetical protein
LGPLGANKSIDAAKIRKKKSSVQTSGSTNVKIRVLLFHQYKTLGLPVYVIVHRKAIFFH